jgi:hypothetical protein
VVIPFGQADADEEWSQYFRIYQERVLPLVASHMTRPETVSSRVCSIATGLEVSPDDFAVVLVSEQRPVSLEACGSLVEDNSSDEAVTRRGKSAVRKA